MEILKSYTIQKNREIIYLEAIKELAFRIKDPNQRSPYNLVRISAVLRLLLIDRLYDAINKTYKLKIRLKISSHFLQGSAISSLEHPQSSSTIFKYLANESGQEIDLPKFLKQNSLVINNQYLKQLLSKRNILETYTVSDLIKLVANAHGGVHLETWDSEIPSYLMTDATSPFNINSNSMLHDLLHNIAELTIQFLDPLSAIVEQNLRDEVAIAWESSSYAVVMSSSEVDEKLKRDNTAAS